MKTGIFSSICAVVLQSERGNFEVFRVIAEAVSWLVGSSWQHLLEHLFRAHPGSKSHSPGKRAQAVLLSGSSPAQNS